MGFAMSRPQIDFWSMPISFSNIALITLAPVYKLRQHYPKIYKEVMADTGGCIIGLSTVFHILETYFENRDIQILLEKIILEENILSESLTSSLRDLEAISQLSKIMFQEYVEVGIRVIQHLVSTYDAAKDFPSLFPKYFYFHVSGKSQDRLAHYRKRWRASNDPTISRQVLRILNSVANAYEQSYIDIIYPPHSDAEVSDMSRQSIEFLTPS
jgi:hypothetical protein